MRRATCLSVIFIVMAFPVMVFAGPRAAGQLSPDGSIRATSEPDCTIMLWDTVSDQRIITLYKPLPVTHMRYAQSLSCLPVRSSFSPDGKLLATQRSAGSIYLWDLTNTGKVVSQVGTFPAGGQVSEDLEFSPDSRLIVAVAMAHLGKRGREGRIAVWDISTRDVLFRASSSKDRVFRSAAFSPDGKMLMAIEGPPYGHTSGLQETIKLLDIERGKELVTLKGKSASFSQDGNFLIVSDSGHPDMLWDIRAGELRVLKKRVRAVQSKSK